MLTKLKTQPYCRCCGKPIKKWTQHVFLSERAGPAPGSGACGDTAYLNGKPWPTTRAEAQALSNKQVVACSYHRKVDGSKRMWSFSTWDGESYADDLFCTNNCAIGFARAVAKAQPGLVTKRYTDAVGKKGRGAA